MRSFFQVIGKAGKGNQGLTVPETQSAALQVVLHGDGKLEKANEIGDAGAIFACAGCNLLLCQTKLATEPLKRAGLLNGVQVFTLQVLNDGDLHCLLVGDLAYDSGNSSFAGAF